MRVSDIPLEEIDALIAEHVMGEPRPKDLIDGVKYHGRSGYDPENPWPKVEGVLNDVSGSVGIISKHDSDGGNWTIVRRYENKDRPEWVPYRFSNSLKLAQKAVDKFWENEWHDEETPPTMLLEYFPRPSLDHKWMAYWNGKYGYGKVPSEAICRLLLIHALNDDDPENDTFEEEPVDLDVQGFKVEISEEAGEHLKRKGIE